MVGQVRYWFPKDGYGFIRSGLKDYYVAVNNLIDAKALERGAYVEFFPEQTKRPGKADRARCVRPF